MERGEAATATLNSQLSTLNSARAANHEINPAPLTDADIDRGYVLVEEDDNAAVIDVPTNAVTVGNWHLHGARSSIGNHRLDLSPWSFPMGTNGAAFSSFWYFVEGKLRPTPRDAAHEICAVGVPMLAMQGASCLWLSADDDDSRTIIWDNFFLNGDTNAPVTAQVTLWPDGAFATQSNNLRRVYARNDPRDWDGDGLANEIDPAPKSNDGDCFGTGEAWWAANLRAVAATNALPEAYYTLAFTATADRTRIAVTCDGASDLGDIVILANAGQTCRVPLLKGANYVVRADAPLTDVALGDENAHVVSFAPEGFDITYPLDCSFARSGDDYSLTVAPAIPGLTLASLSGGCCALNVTSNGFSWTCADTCTCGGAEQLFEVRATWAGYSRDFFCPLACACGEDAADPSPVVEPQGGPFAASVAVSFSKDAVIFEDAYENMPGVGVGRRSTASTLTIRVNGGSNGGTLTASAVNLGRLQKNAGPAFPVAAVQVPAGQSMTYEMNYVGLEASDAADDIVVAATFAENETGATLSST